uniref:Uncharacterized protein n=1 Tax=Avena sativa TaxID=4498 RepID=A0ACD5ZTP6_AVESA
MAYHQRSASTPSSPRSNKPEIEKELQSLSTVTSSPSATIDTTCDGLRRLEGIYICIEEMMCIPSNQVTLCQTLQRKAVDAEIGRSLVLLDLCNSMQESFMELKMTVQQLLLALSRGEDASSQVKAYSRLSKKAQKQFKKVSKKAFSDDKDCRVVMLMAEAREISISLLETTCRILAKQVEMPKAFLKSKFVCGEEQLRVLECSIGGCSVVRHYESRPVLISSGGSQAQPRPRRHCLNSPPLSSFEKNNNFLYEIRLGEY